MKLILFTSFFVFFSFGVECILQSFVNTPVILERFVSLENEILHIESSFQANALSMSNGTPYEGTTGSCILRMF
ncbi:hypothetical protein VIGAN_11188800 [Vigna angularis var. angularis]|uniref:Uncharacterized protein n=1 Tax=Vigna angularis var. angularis TaxID=157739 RepID=A0A0S3TBF8_PHAAN|nr:hypothetical protein VIGAN_11188800 [Vigna angularis var. angularis]